MTPLRLVLWIPVAVYMAAIFYASSLSVIPGPVGYWFSDTVLHMACYGGLALVTLRALAGGKRSGVNVGAGDRRVADCRVVRRDR